MNSQTFIACDPEQAQKSCNFIVFRSTSLPPDLVVKEQHLRQEPKPTKRGLRQVSNRSTYRQALEGSNRVLVIKQFLYDWAPPAYDYPCLWRNDKIATPLESPPPKAQFINNNALWFGKNYRKQDAATIEIERTRIEMTFEKGTFLEHEIVSLCKGFLPANAEMAKQILNTPFSQLSYNKRHEESVVSVPVGYWQHMRGKPLFCFPLAKDEISVKIPNFLQSIINELKKREYLLNSGFCFGRKKNQQEELEFIFEHQKSPGCLIRVLYTSMQSPHPISFPPILCNQECIHKSLSVNGNIYYYATSKNFEFGSHEIVFNKESFNFMLIIKPAPWTSCEWIMKLLTSLEGIQ